MLPTRWTPLPTELAEEPTKLATEPRKLAVEPTNLATEPIKLAVEPTKLAIEPTKLAVEPIMLATEPTKLAVEPTRLAVESRKLAVEPTKLAIESRTEQTTPATSPRSLIWVRPWASRVLNSTPERSNEASRSYLEPLPSLQSRSIPYTPASPAEANERSTQVPQDARGTWGACALRWYLRAERFPWLDFARR